MKKPIDTGMRILFLFAVLWSIGAGIWILLTPQQIHTIEVTSTPEGSQQSEETIKQVSFYQVQGAWGVFILFVFAGLYSLAGYYFLRSLPLPGAVFALLSLVLTYLAGLSLGPLYLPGAVALLAGLMLWLGRSLLANRQTA